MTTGDKSKLAFVFNFVLLLTLIPDSTRLCTPCDLTNWVNFIWQCIDSGRILVSSSTGSVQLFHYSSKHQVSEL